jgi:hypothetical protein
MAVLTWDEVGDRIYQTGIDRGVLYLQDGTVAVWNGLISVEETPSWELKTSYLDGVKYLEMLVPSEFQAKLTAFTYPDEFDTVNGIAHVSPGLSYHEQPSKSFNLSYRTKVGNDIENEELGYKIHILYNVIAAPDSYSYGSTQDSSVEPITFGWNLIGVPPKLEKFRPTVHISVDSRTTPPEVLKLIEDKLYGTEDFPPSFPAIDEVTSYFDYVGALIVIDFGDGTWMAIDNAGTFLSMINPTTFSIAGADATMLNATTYEISTTSSGP